MQIRERFLNGLKWSAIGKLMSQLLSWAATLVVMRHLDAADYGLMAMTMMVITLLSNLNEFGFGSALVRGETLDRRTCGAVFGAMLGVATTLNVAMWLSAAPLAHFFNEPRLAELLQVAGLIFLIAALSTVPESVLRREMDFKTIAYADLSSVLTTSLLTLWLTFSGAGVWSLLLGNIAGSAVRTLHLLVKSPLHVWPNADFGQLRGMVRYGSNLTISRFTFWFSSQSDVMIGAKLLGKTSLGFYSVALSLASLPMQKIMQVVNQVAFSAIARIKNSGQPVSTELARGLWAINLLTLPCAVLLALLAEPLIAVLIGEKWVAAAPALQCIAVAMPIRLVSSMLATALIAVGHTGTDLRNTINGALVMAAGFFIGALYGDVNGLAAAWTVGVPLLLLMNFPRTGRLLDLRWSQLWATFRTAVLASAPMVAALLVMNALRPAGHPFLSLVLEGTLAVLLYLSALWMIDGRCRAWARQLLEQRFAKRP